MLRRRSLPLRISTFRLSPTLILSDDLFRESKEELRYQAREGFTVIEQDDTPDIVLDRADQAMYRDKAAA